MDASWNRIVYGDYANWAKSFGDWGSSDAEFIYPSDAVTDGLGNIYVADTYNGRVVRLEYDATEEEIDPDSFTSLGASVLEQPADLDVDDRGDTGVSNDYLWVIDKSLNKVLKFNLSGQGQHLLSITSLHNPSSGATYSDLSGLSGVAVRKSAANGNNSTSNHRLYLIDWKLRKLFLVGADDISGGQATIYRETDAFPSSYLLTDVESDFFGDVWIVNETGNAIKKYTWDLKYLDSQGGLNRPTSVASSRRHDKYMAITERWTETTGSRTYTHGAHINDLYINPGTHVTYFNFKTTNYGRVVAKVYKGTTRIMSVGFGDNIYPSGHKSGSVYQSGPSGTYKLKVWAYAYGNENLYHYVEQEFEFLTAWPENLTLENMSIGGEQIYTATNSITAGPNFTVESGGDVTFRTNVNGIITLASGFTAVDGSAFHAYIGEGTFKKISDDLIVMGEDSTRTPTDSRDDEPVPVVFSLSHAYPNPFNPSATIRFGLPEAAPTWLVVYDILGREVIRLVDGHLEPGYHAVVWHGKTATGIDVPSGIYLARLVTPEYTRSIKMLLLK